tara:strand:+ start:1052 stop:1528 length:477 start_codon:yes stop_codon:yes gene_type:complete
MSTKLLIANILSENNLTLSIAESCSAGGISSEICSVPGSSSYFMGGVIAYSNKSKRRDLNVEDISIKKFTEVSSEVAVQMSEGIKERFSTDFSLSTTGYAGPNGKDVGKVYISVSRPSKTEVKKFFFEGDRKEITDKIIEESIQFLFSEIKLHISNDK